MRKAPDLIVIILASLLFLLAILSCRDKVRSTEEGMHLICAADKQRVPLSRPVAWVGDLIGTRRIRAHRNRKRNWERWQRRLARRARQRPTVKGSKRRLAAQLPGRTDLIAGRWRPQPPVLYPGGSRQQQPAKPEPAPDPLAAIRQQRGWIDWVEETELWALLRQIRWLDGLRCPDCGEDDPRYLQVLDRHYRGGMYRYRCRVCAEAGDPGQGGTFTDLTDTIFAGTRLDIGALWLTVEWFVTGRAAVETAKEMGVHRHTTQRLFRLLRGALYQQRSEAPIALGPGDVVEGDEVYITAGVKGEAGGLQPTDQPRRRGLKRRGRGTWDSDRLPILGLLRRGGQVRLFVLRNVQGATIQPIIQQMVQQGASVYTDGYRIYHYLSQAGYHHQSVNHSAGEYARNDVHCNTMEATWSWLRQSLRTYRGVSKVYLPLYVAQFEFGYNRRHQTRWSRVVDVMAVALQAEAAALLDRVGTAEFAQVCPVAG